MLIGLIAPSSRFIASRHLLGARAVIAGHSVARPFFSSSTINSRNPEKSEDTKGGDSGASASHPNSLKFVSHFKSPIVQQLWVAREEAKANAKANGSGHLPRSRFPSQSTTSVSYPFSTNEFLKESYRNPWGQVKFGKILEDLDALAGNIAFAHVRDPSMTIVTASVDKILLSKVPTLDSDLVLSGKVTYVGTSSMEIRIQCRNDSNADNEYWLEAFFTFVATDPETKRPTKIPPLKPDTLLEERYFEAGKQRAAAKKAARMALKHGSDGSSDGKIRAVANNLMEQAGPVLNMPSISCPDSILMSQTELHHCEIAQPQTRNLASNIFGGFLMRRACELAFSAAYIFAGALPTFYEVDEVSFGIPVNVGDLLKYHCRVLYISSQEEGHLRSFVGLTKTVSLEVEAWVIDPVHSSAKLSNKFYFTFALPSGVPMRRVLPSNMEEATKIATRMHVDRSQTQES